MCGRWARGSGVALQFFSLAQARTTAGVWGSSEGMRRRDNGAVARVGAGCGLALATSCGIVRGLEFGVVIL